VVKQGSETTRNRRKTALQSNGQRKLEQGSINALRSPTVRYSVTGQQQAPPHLVLLAPTPRHPRYHPLLSISPPTLPPLSYHLPTHAATPSYHPPPTLPNPFPVPSPHAHPAPPTQAINPSLPHRGHVLVKPLQRFIQRAAAMESGHQVLRSDQKGMEEVQRI
jgi:hypothetical protein